MKVEKGAENEPLRPGFSHTFAGPPRLLPRGSH
jgi:hypothetical protein